MNYLYNITPCLRRLFKGARSLSLLSHVVLQMFGIYIIDTNIWKIHIGLLAYIHVCQVHTWSNFYLCRVEDLLRKRYLKAESLWKTYSFINEFFRTISTERL